MASPLPAQPEWNAAPPPVTGDNVQALFAEAITLHQAGRLVEAVDHYARIIRLQEELPEVYSNLGAALMDLGLLTQAEFCQRRAIELQPDFANAHNNLGNVLKQLARFAEAEAAYRHAIALAPGFAGAYGNLGTVLTDLNRLEEAEAAHRHAIALSPDDAAAHSNLGNVLKNMGRLDVAETAYRRAIALNPNYDLAYCNLGIALKNLGRLDEAETALRRAIALKPDLSHAHSNLGNVHMDLGRLNEAEACYRHAITLDPNNAEAYCNLGAALQELDRPNEAEEALRRALALKPNVPESLSNLANVLKDLEQLHDAETLLRRAIALSPDFAAAYNNLSVVLKETGRLAEAGAAAEQAIKLAPRRAMYYRNLGEIRRIGVEQPYLTALEELACDPAALSPGDQVELRFALGNAYDDLGRTEDAFAQLLIGCGLQRRRLAYDEAGMLGALQRIKGVFTPDLIASRQHLGDPSRRPVFIVGMMRSGSTLVEQILSSHPQVFGAGELKALYKNVRDAFEAHSPGSDFPDVLPELPDEYVHRIGASYLAEIERLAPDAARITDKMPSNYYFAGMIHLALPNATIIHVVRDPVDTCMSCFSKLFTEPQNHTYDLAELGRYYRGYESMMAHWRHVLPPGRILDVRYEDVVADIEGEARRIVAHCGLEWDERCLSFHNNERPIRTASAVQVRRPLYKSSVGRWRDYKHLIGPLLAELGGPE